MNKKKPSHVHRPRCLNSWTGCPGLSHEEWIEVAGSHIDQDTTWRSYEFHGRRNHAADREFMPFYYDLGGEA